MIYDAIFKMDDAMGGVIVNFIIEGHEMAHLKGILMQNKNMKNKFIEISGIAPRCPFGPKRAKSVNFQDF